MMKDVIYAICSLLLILTVLLTVFAYTIMQPVCYARTAEINLPARWSFFGECQIEVEKDRWIPLENWRYIENTGEY